SSGKFRSGCHSSNPSRQTSESPSTAPVDAFSRIAARRIGPTGTPAIPTYQSSLGVVVCGADIGAGRSLTERANAAAIPVTFNETGPSPAGAGAGAGRAGAATAAAGGGGPCPATDASRPTPARVAPPGRGAGGPPGRGAGAPTRGTWAVPCRTD